MSKNIYIESCYNIEVNRYFVYTISSIETSTVSRLTPFTYFLGKQYRLRTVSRLLQELLVTFDFDACLILTFEKAVAKSTPSYSSDLHFSVTKCHLLDL